MIGRLQLVLALVLVLALGAMGTATAQENLEPHGRTVHNIDVQLQDGYEFTGRIVNLDFVDEDGDQVLATGRLIGTLTHPDGTTERINEAFETWLPVDVAEEGNPTQILFLELGPIFLDVLGLIVEVPDPIILEIRAEEGPGQLLGNLLVALLGLLDP
jgi:hypothetical protein